MNWDSAFSGRRFVEKASAKKIIAGSRRLKMSHVAPAPGGAGLRTAFIPWLLFAVLFLAAVVRVWGIWHLLPYNHVSDEQYIVNNALSLSRGALPDTLGWPATTMIFLVGVTYMLIYSVGLILGIFQSATDYAIAFIQDPTYWYLVPRVYSALSGIATVFLVFLLGRRMFNRRVGAVAALFLAISPLHVSMSQTGLADAPMTMLVTLALLLCYRLSVKGGTSTYALAGVTAGLATATKFNAGLLVFPILASHVFLRRRWGLVGLARDRNIWIACGCFMLGLYVGFPYLVTAVRPAVQSIISTPIGQASGGRALGAETLDLGWLYLVSQLLPQAMGAPVAVLGGAGLLYGLWRRNPGMLVPLSFFLPYFLVLGSSRALYERYALPMVPILVLLAALGLDAMMVRLKDWAAGAQARTRFPAASAVAVLALGLVSLSSLYPVAVASYSKSAMDTRAEARQWVHQNIPPGATVAIDDYGPYLLPTRESLVREDRWWQEGFNQTRQVVLKAATMGLPRYSRLVEADPQYDLVYIGINSDTSQEDMDRFKPEWVIISSGTYLRYMDEVAIVRYSDRTKLKRQFYQQLENAYRTVKVFDSDNMDLTGPIIKIYRRTGIDAIQPRPRDG